jgi:1-pyrroline-5-carboxylate dehydrogenase
MVTDFRNEPIMDFSQTRNHGAMLDAIRAVEARSGVRIPLIIGGKEVWTDRQIASLNPSNTSEVLASVSSAGPVEADLAVRAAADARLQWHHMGFEGRARILLRAAAIMRRRRYELDAVEILEAGKPWVEADGDVAEAIDFCDFYGREALRWSGDHPVTPLAGEENRLFYVPLGVVVVIPPWNFPLAITTGMTVAALVTGNPVVLKPASPTPLIAWYLVDVLREAGLPEGVLQYCPGSGGAMGDVLVGHPLTRAIAFTGSKPVGLHVNELASKTAGHQIWLKRVVAEMGGKDAIVVAEDADVLAAAQGIVASAFGFQGQKCSACSRAIIVDAVYEPVMNEVVRLAKAIRVGPAKDPASDMGPVISESAMKGILEYIEIGRREGRLLCGGDRPDLPGYFINPTVFGDVWAGARIEQEEIFGPVLACIRAEDFDQALAIANDTEFGLTGAVYSRSQHNLERAASEFEVGNLYLNRKCTGALVGVHPFGGFNMSGTDSKAGGRDYLGLFLQAKSVALRL